MNDPLITDPLALATAQQPDSSGWRKGTVTRADAGGVDVLVGGGTVHNPGLLGGVLPVVGQVVAMGRQDGSWLLLGVIGDAATALPPVLPAARISRSNAQSIPNNALTDLDMDTVELDTFGMVDLGADNSAITCRMTAHYDIGMVAAFATNGTGVRHAALLVAGTIVAYDSRPADTIGATGLHVARQILLVAGQKVTTQTRQNSGAGLNTSTVEPPTLWVAYRCPS